MAVNATAIVNIDVNDKSFKDFMGNFDKYQKVLAQTPTAWRAMNKEQRALMSSFASTVTVLQHQATLMHKMAAYAKDVTHSFEHAGKHMTHMGHRVKEVGHGILHITEKLMKWGAIAAGIVTGTGFAGFFGLDKLGEFVRKGAVGGARAGMSQGSLKALENEFGENYGMDIKGVASAGATAAESPASGAARVYKRLGLDPEQLKGTKRVTELMRRMREEMKERGLSPERFAELFNTGEVNVNAGDLRAMSEETDKEFAYRVKHVETGAGQLDMKRDEVKKWQAFMTELGHATERMQTIIASYLTPLLKTFTENSDKWLTELEKFLNSEDMKKFVEDLPKQAKKIWEWMKGFAEDLEWVGKKMGWIKASEEEKKTIREQAVIAGQIPYSEMTPDEQKKRDAAVNKARDDLLNAVDPSEWFKSWYQGANKGGAQPGAGVAPSASGITAPMYGGLADAVTKGVIDAFKAMGQGFSTPGGPNPGGRGYQTGTDLGGVPQDGTYKLHRGEIVLPRNQAEILRGSGMADWKRAITGIESGGNYGIVNPKSGATGKYQVMPANIPSWTKQALGYSMTTEQFRQNPAAQEKVFETIFQQYVTKFGNPIDAASAWFSGQPAVGNKAGPDAMGTTVPGYIQKFIAAVTGKGGGGHMNLNIADNTGGNVQLALSNVMSTGPLPLFPL